MASQRGGGKHHGHVASVFAGLKLSRDKNMFYQTTDNNAVHVSPATLLMMLSVYKQSVSHSGKVLNPLGGRSGPSKQATYSDYLQGGVKS